MCFVYSGATYEKNILPFQNSEGAVNVVAEAELVDHHRPSAHQHDKVDKFAK